MRRTVKLKAGGRRVEPSPFDCFHPPKCCPEISQDAAIIYQNGGHAPFYDAFTREMRGGPDKIIAYINGALCAVDREQGARIAIPVSRWKLMEIGLACFLAGLKGKGAAPRLLEPVPLPEPPPEALTEPLAEAMDQNSPEEEWERLMKEMRDLSRPHGD